MVIFGVLVFIIYVIFAVATLVDCYHYIKEKHDYED